MTAKKRIIVIGGGMAGASAAHHLTKHGYDVTILEQNNRLGGRVRTEIVDGIPVEYGAQFISNMYPNLRKFLKQNKLSKYLYAYRLHPAQYRNGKVQKFSPQSALYTNMLSWPAKLLFPLSLLRPLLHWRVFNPLKPERLAAYDQHAISKYFTSRAGKELLDYAYQPAITGAFYWLPDIVKKTSEAMLLFLSKAVVLGGFRKFSFGLQRIPEKLSQDSQVLLNHAVLNVKKDKNNQYTVRAQVDTKERIFIADGVVCATTASVISKIFSDLTPIQHEFFTNIRYSSVAYLGQTYRKEHVKGELNIISPKPEGMSLSRLSILYPQGVNNTSTDVALMMSGTVESLPDYSEATIVNTITDQAKIIYDDVFTTNAQPLSTFTWHWEEALPVLETGYFKKLKVFLEEETKSTEPLVFAGDYLNSPFMEGAFCSGKLAAKRLTHLLR